MAVAVISEFNPFHNGHKYLLQSAKQITNESVIAVMSGSFTQRGEVALTDKFERTKTALRNGADLVVELPTVYAISNAQRFARCGVSIAKSFDCVNYLAFGCETDNINALLNASKSTEDEQVKKLISEEMKNGNYYPRAVESSVRAVFGDETADVLTSPNNILAVEYIRNLGEKIKPLPIKRTGVGHDSDITTADIASASQIRNLLRAGQSVDSFVPEEPKNITYPENLERAVLYKLRSMSAEEIAKLPDVSEGLENRIFDTVRKYNSVVEIISAVKTKRYTHARLRRIIACALLGITEEMQNMPVNYARVLGFTEKGAELLKSCNFEVVTSIAKSLKNGGRTAGFIKKDILATDISALAYEKILPAGSDYTYGIVKI